MGAHAWLLEGGSREGRMERALALLKTHFADDPGAEEKLMRGTFVDLVILEPEEPGKDITVAHVEALIEIFAQKPFASTGKACLIPCGERMNEHAQNKLLKLLEEPAPGDILLILAENAEQLLPTVRSRLTRCLLGYACSTPAQFTEDMRTLAAVLVYEKGALAEANHVLTRYETSREEAVAFLDVWRLFLRNLVVGGYSPALIEDSALAETLRTAASKVGSRHAKRMREGVLLAERALVEIERGGRLRYALRGMALSMRTAANEV